MTPLTVEEQMDAVGGGFWGGVACGLGIVTAFAAFTSASPLGAAALLTYGATAISCATA